MVMPSMTHRPIWGSDGQTPTIKLATAPVSVLGSLIDNLIKSRVDVVCKLDLSYGSAAKCSCPNTKPNNPLKVNTNTDVRNAY